MGSSVARVKSVKSVRSVAVDTGRDCRMGAMVWSCWVLFAICIGRIKQEG